VVIVVGSDVTGVARRPRHHLRSVFCGEQYCLSDASLASVRRRAPPMDRSA
jgi:hypothetical protein